MIEGLIVPTGVLDDIRRHAREALPNECCGLLVGAGDAILSVARSVPTRNAAADPRRGFAVDPQEQFNALHALRGGPLRLIGHYHSHPGSPAAPSATDLEMAFDPMAVWLIVGIGGADDAEFSAFFRPAGDPSFKRIGLSQSS